MSGNNQGQQGQQGQQGRQGGAAAGGGAFYPDRIDLPFASAVSNAVGGVSQPVSNPAFRYGQDGTFGRRWTAAWRAWHVLAEFADQPAWRDRQQEADGQPRAGGGVALTGWRTRLVAGGTGLAGAVDKEIDALVVLAEDDRADALGEILSQNDEFISDFLALLCATPGSHPATNAVMQAASMVAGLAAQHFKKINDRPRPSQVCPALRPPLDVPGHAAYPSGHATQAFLIERCIGLLLTGTPAEAALPVVSALAARIAHNREIAGFHYPSDTSAGKELAGELLPVVRGSPTFSELFDHATAEWKPSK